MSKEGMMLALMPSAETFQRRHSVPEMQAQSQLAIFIRQTRASQKRLISQFSTSRRSHRKDVLGQPVAFRNASKDETTSVSDLMISLR